jgi:hypothetical protein
MPKNNKHFLHVINRFMSLKKPIKKMTMCITILKKLTKLFQAQALHYFKHKSHNTNKNMDMTR